MPPTTRQPSIESPRPSRRVVASVVPVVPIALGGLSWAIASRHAVAQTVDRGAPSGSVASRFELMQVVERFDGTTLAIIVAAIVALALFGWLVLAMVRREKRPAARPRRRTRPRGTGDLSATTLNGATDWGHDQNKRAALVRSPVTIPHTTVGLPSLESATTQWSMSDVHNAANVPHVPDDALGKSPASNRTSFNPYFRGESAANSIEVVEVADALQQAELLVQLGDPKKAMTLLSQHIRETEKPGPAVWLMLLGLYQSTGREAQYNALASGFRVLFNAEVPTWAASTDEEERDLQAYPTVVTRLQAVWGGPAARAGIEALLKDDRGGSRKGFTLSAYRDLLFLVEILDVLDAMQADDDERNGIRRKLGMPT